MTVLKVLVSGAAACLLAIAQPRSGDICANPGLSWLLSGMVAVIVLVEVSTTAAFGL